ncbi:MAG: DNA-directed RNA polymerase subunit D [Nanoarchaeota archaeon]
MDVKVIDESKEKLQMRITGEGPAYVNALRRFMAFEVPVMAIEDVEFRVNNSILYDEMVAHRLGLVPLKTDLESYNLSGECSCKGAGCAQCRLTLTLKVQGPKTVYAGDMKSKDPKVKPVFPQTPIVKLLDGQDMEFEATAVLGVGKEHTKWAPGLIFYRNVPKITIKGQPKMGEAIAKKCPSKCFDYKDGKLSLNAKNADSCILCNECVDLSSGGVMVETEDDYFVFVESFGQLPPEDIVIKAVEVFNTQVQGFTKLLKEVPE